MTRDKKYYEAMDRAIGKAIASLEDAREALQQYRELDHSTDSIGAVMDGLPSAEIGNETENIKDTVY